MGAVCYKPKPTTITQADILKALNDKHLKESITEPDGVKTLKTDEQYSNNLLTFGSITQIHNFDTNDQILTSQSNSKQKQPRRSRLTNLNPNIGGLGQLELNILTYYGCKDDIYETLTLLSRKSLYFMKRNYSRIESNPNIRHANERIKFIHTKQIEEHTSGVNQLIRINDKELVTASDDCFMKFWTSNNMKVETSIPTETITCIAITGGQNPKQKDILVAGCHSGNLLIVSCQTKAKKEQINNAHYNLIRVIVTLEALKNKYFVTADVCGIVKVWTSSFKPTEVMEIQQEGAISYNSMIEVVDMLPKRQSYEDTAMIACALKSQKINIILLMPNSGTYQLIKTLKTQQKPTCLIQLTIKHLAIAVGSLKEESSIEVHDVLKSKLTSNLKVHKDMIDSLLKLEFRPEKTKSTNPYITWFLSASRDRQIALWKLIDGKVMKRNSITQGAFFGSPTNKSTLQQSMTRQFEGNRSNTHKGLQERKRQSQPNQSKKKRRVSQEDEEEEDIEENDDRMRDQESDPEGDERNPILSQTQKFNKIEENKKDIQSLMLNSENDENNSFSTQQQLLLLSQQAAAQQDHYHSFDSGHKDFIRSMAQINNGNTLVTASEDKYIKLFTITF